jgi:hypothetical protein
MMYPVSNCNHNETTEEVCQFCGFFIADFRDDDYVYRNPSEPQDIADGDYISTFSVTATRQVTRRYEYHDRSSFNIELVYPEWLKAELKRLCLEVPNSGKSPCCISSII